MGDYAKNGVKLGTCGRAYYATKSMIENLQQDSETRSYLNPTNKAHFAFPYPEFDNQNAGDISIFHKPNNELLVLEIDKKHRTHHKQIVHHIHPSGGQGLNLFCDCPYHSNENVSKNFTHETVKFYLKYQTFTGESDKMAIVGECIYCGESNIFEEHEAIEAAVNLVNQAKWNETQANRKEYQGTANQDSHNNKALYLRLMASRILETY